MLKFISDKIIDLYSGVTAKTMSTHARKEYFKNIYIGVGLGFLFWFVVFNMCVSFAATSFAEFKAEIDSTISQIYKVAFTVGTAITALCAVIAYAMRMSPNQQRASIASQWLIRIFIGYAALASIGIVITIIKTIATQYGAWGFKTHLSPSQGDPAKGGYRYAPAPR